jgi:ubiquinone/menaquinone biosynthesis C-methylase UbiE
MPKSVKELAFIRDLYVHDQWTRRFTELVDKHIDLSDSENLLYLNAGTGAHALTIDEKHGEKLNIFASVDDVEQLAIARDKGAAVKSGVDFSTIRFEDDAFDAVLADATFVAPGEIDSVIQDAVRVARTGGDIAVFLPGSGSFGEVFSLLWEVLFNEDLAEHGSVVEDMIRQLPTVESLEDAARQAGLVNIHNEVATEIFEYDNGAAFVSAPLVADFLMPQWLAMLEEEEKERVSEKLAQLIDSEDADLTFRFSVKVNLLTGEKE